MSLVQRRIAKAMVAWLLLLWQPLAAQHEQALKDICYLTSNKMAGRGYVKQGHLKAAKFIREEFKSCGLIPLTENWFQNFSFPVTTFPGKMKVALDDRTLIPGADFLIHPSSAGGRKTLPLAQADSADILMRLEQNSDTCYVVTRKVYDSLRQYVNRFLRQNQKGALVILEAGKLTWSVGAEPFTIPVFEVLESAYKTSAKNISFHVEQKYYPEFRTQNIIGMIRGSAQPDSFIVFTAHYDHLGMMGNKTIFPGANDNASGTAMLLALARHYTSTANKPRYSMLFIAFSAEEAGLLGSEYYTEHPLLPLSSIHFLINLDLAGNGSEGITVVNATEFKSQYNLLDSINTAMHALTSVHQRGKARNSDHYYFSEKGVPSFFIYTMGGAPWYHDVNDKCATLTLSYFDKFFSLLTAFANEL